MICGDLMRREVEAISPDLTVAAAARRMRDELVGLLVVCGPDKCVLGVVTDRDIAVRVCADDRSAVATPVSAVMSREVLCCAPEDPLSRAEELMVRYQKWRVLITDSENRLQGVISLTDLAQYEEPLRAARILREITSRGFRAVPRSRRNLAPA